MLKLLSDQMKGLVMIIFTRIETTLPTGALCHLSLSIMALQACNETTKQLYPCRKRPLKVVITSATLDGEKLSAYFGECPVLTVPGRVFDVQVIHSKDNHEGDIMNAAVDTALQIHLDEPAGDILVFLTGQAEIDKAYHFMLSSHLCDVAHLLFPVDCLAQIHD